MLEITLLIFLTLFGRAREVGTIEEPVTLEQPYEDPAACQCRIVRGKRVCNSACLSALVDARDSEPCAIRPRR